MNADMASTKYDNDIRQLKNNDDIYGLHQLRAIFVWPWNGNARTKQK